MSGYYSEETDPCNHPQYGCDCDGCLAWFGKQKTPGGSTPVHRRASDTEPSDSDVTIAAQPSGDSSCRDCGGPQHIIYPCPQWQPQTMIACCDALAEVERQAALVARLDADLLMLRMLGRGYSRRDLACEPWRKAKR